MSFLFYKAYKVFKVLLYLLSNNRRHYIVYLYLVNRLYIVLRNNGTKGTIVGISKELIVLEGP